MYNLYKFNKIFLNQISQYNQYIINRTAKIQVEVEDEEETQLFDVLHIKTTHFSYI